MIKGNSLKIYYTASTIIDNAKVTKTTIEQDNVEMDLFKRNVKGHARIQIKKIMVNSAKHIKLLRSDGELVETFVEICLVWKNWNRIYDVNVPQKMFYIMYGWFDEHPNWSNQLELDYMILNNIQYEKKHLTTNKPRTLDTICMLMTIVKNDCVKMINRRSMGTHNLKITITRRDGQGTKSQHSMRRTKGEFHESFLTYHNTLKNKKETVKKQKGTNKYKFLGIK